MPNKPLRCFEGSAEPYQPFWNFLDEAQSESGQTELELYGVLSEFSWWGDEITPSKFKDDLYKYGKGGPVLMKVNSPGGDVVAASVMRAILTDYPGEVTARVDGMAASAAVAVTTAAKRVLMLDTAYMMIHDPAVVLFMAWLDIDTLGQLRDELISIKDGIVNAYENRTGLGATKLSNMMKAETWMSARQAVDFGFADEVISGGQSDKAKNVGYVNCLRNYANVPPMLMQAFTKELPTAVVPSEPLLSEDQKREAQTLRSVVSNILKGTEHARS
jgi:ATP-dependent Clp protease, protease subunit